MSNANSPAPKRRFMKSPSIGLPALTAGALLAISASCAAAAVDLTVAKCTTAWKNSGASASCGAQVRSSTGTSLASARISVETRTATVLHPVFFWRTQVVEVQLCSIQVQCLHSGNSVAASGICPTKFLGGVEDVKKAINNDGTLEAH